MLVVILSQTLGGLGLAAGITVGALIAQEILGTDNLAGIPSAIFTLGSSFAAFMIGRLTQKNGRRLGLATGFLLGGMGALGVIFATAVENIYFLFLSLFIYGFGTATNLQARYAGSDLAEPQDRSKAISIAMVATTFGAVVGPNLSATMSNLAITWHLPPLTGAFILSACAYLASGILLFVFLRPDPYQVAKALQQEKNMSEKIVPILDKRALFIGALIMIVTLMLMILSVLLTTYLLIAFMKKDIR